MYKEIVIRKATINDAESKGYVHYHSWNETYTGLIDQEYLDSRSVDKCTAAAKRHPENTYVAIVNDKIVGFSCYSKARDNDIDEAGEIIAIYILSDYFGLGIGRKLMDICYKELEEYKNIILWVLKTNKHAIDFYEYVGFAKDGTEKEIIINEKVRLLEIRMILTNPKAICL
jgi:ribosomal protein S18 acetylase RimI-like enzyme